MKTNALVIGVSKLEFINILLTYYPKNVNETFDIYLFIDNKKVTHEQIKEIIKVHNIKIFNEATFININDVYDYYTKKHGYQDRAKQMVYTQGCIFKILAPIYLYENFKVTRVYTSDDDVFIFNDLSYMFDKYKGFAIKKENLFGFKNKDKYEVLAAYNEIFGTDFSLEQMNSLSVNAGNVMYDYDPDMEEYIKRFINHPMIHHLFFDFNGYVSWTIEQRWQHFNLHRLIKENKTTNLLEAQDLKLIINIDKEAYLNGIQPIYLKQVTPSLLHYAVGVKKPIFLRQFLQGIEWKFGFIYEPKYELKDILYNDAWISTSFKKVQKQIKTESYLKKILPVF